MATATPRKPLWVAVDTNVLLDLAEVNDSYLVAESALAGCRMLLSSDGHVVEIPAAKLTLVLAAADVETLVISSPRTIARKFGR